MTRERPVREGDEVAREGLGRLLALTDGVFAIALTVLVIEITLPEGTSDAGLGTSLGDLGPRYFAYVLSFAVIARFWSAHHLGFGYIGRSDDTLIWLNFLLLLLLVAFLPFPTSVLGEHGNTPTGAAFYGAALVCTSAASGALWWYASGRGRLLRPEVDRRLVRRRRISGLASTVYFAASLVEYHLRKMFRKLRRQLGGLGRKLLLGHCGLASKSSRRRRRPRRSRPPDAADRRANLACPHEDHQHDARKGRRDECSRRARGKQADRSRVHRDGVQPAPGRASGRPADA